MSEKLPHVSKFGKRLDYDESKTLADINIGSVKCHFLDSGSFSLWTIAAKWGKEHNRSQWDFYETDEFWQYIDKYARFVKKWRHGIDYFANVDVIPNPELSWRNLRYLEDKHGLRAVPVIHYTTDVKWIEKHIKAGYDFIGLGGLVGSTGQEACVRWLDRSFNLICDGPKRLPRVRVHGFGVTKYELLLRYPWWSVDSTSWTKVGGFGGLIIPHKRGNRFVFNVAPYMIMMSQESPQAAKLGRHYLTLNKAERRIIREWLDHIGIALGKTGANGEEIEPGVLNRHVARRAANLIFFEEMRRSLPEYPWAFNIRERPNFGLVK